MLNTYCIKTSVAELTEKESDPKLEDRETQFVKAVRGFCLILMDTSIVILSMACCGALFVSWNFADWYDYYINSNLRPPAKSIGNNL